MEKKNFRALVIVLSALTLMIGCENGGEPEEETVAEDTAAVAVAEVPESVSELGAFVREGEAQSDMDFQHEYTSEGIRRLAEALSAMAERDGIDDPSFEQTHERLLQQAQQLQQHAQSTEHATQVREAFTAAADLMATLQQQRSPEFSDAVAEVRQAAEAINPDQRLLEQRQAVGTFFARANEALQAMAQTAP